MPKGQAFIGGRLTDAASGETLASINAARGEVLAHVAACDAEGVERPVKSARRGFKAGSWSRTAAG